MNDQQISRFRDQADSLNNWVSLIEWKREVSKSVIENFVSMEPMMTRYSVVGLNRSMLKARSNESYLDLQKKTKKQFSNSK